MLAEQAVVGPAIIRSSNVHAGGSKNVGTMPMTTQTTAMKIEESRAVLRIHRALFRLF
jgi:hypothetical protein